MFEADFTRFYAANRTFLERAVVSYARRNREFAKDALQHGLTESLRKFAGRSFDEGTESEFIRYTLTCAEHYIEREGKRGAGKDDISKAENVANELDLDKELMFEHLEQAIREIPKSQRRAVQIRFFVEERLTLDDCAKIFGASRATFNRELAKAMKALKQKMDVEILA